MYRFVSIRNVNQLHADYLKIYIHDLDGKWNKHVAACPDLAGAMLPGMTPKKLLTASFRQLVDVYLHFINYCNGLTPLKKAAVKDEAKKVFSYKSFATKIAKFLLDPNNQFEIYNCVYCDTIRVSPFDNKGKKVRRFETEHVLDKGECPLVALSLHNFVPSCDTCNGSMVKGTNTIGVMPEEIKHLSPTNPSYDFWHKVLFVVNPKSRFITDIKREDHPEHYEIDFYFRDKTYQRTVELFGLKGKYNADFLMDALRLLDRRDRYTPKVIADAAALLQITPNDYYEEQFEINAYKTEHKPYRKIREDLLGLTVLV